MRPSRQTCVPQYRTMTGVFPFAFEPSGPSALLTSIKFREGELMSERKTARLAGLILGGLFTCALMLNAFAY
jgi:hypothetical protein